MSPPTAPSSTPSSSGDGGKVLPTLDLEPRAGDATARAPGEPVACWDCDAPNEPGRMFCAQCGTFIAVGEKAFSQRPSEDTTRAGDPPVPGPMSLGAYSVAIQRRADRRRTRLALLSAALVAIVGLASIYVATAPGGRPEQPGEKAMLAATPASPVATSAASAASADATTVVPSGMALAEAAIDVELAGLEEDPAAGRSDTGAVDQAVATAASSPASVSNGGVAATTPVPVATPVPAIRPTAAPAARAADAIVWRDGWVCDGALELTDARVRDWTITRVSFLPGNGYERVILHLNRFGAGSGTPASLTAEAFATARVQREVPGVRQPSAGRTTLALQFQDGVKTDVNLRGYRPSGLRSIKELSAYPAGRGSSRVLISSTGSGCFRVRTPAWGNASQKGKAQIIIDLKS